MLNVISLGAGVQSSTMALMAAHGEITPMPDCAIFADTQDEGADTYKHLVWLRAQLPFPVYTPTKGRLSDALFSGDDAARIPAYVEAGGLAKRQCTRNFKIRVIRRDVRRVLGVSQHGYIAPGAVSQWIGISTEEADRMKPTGVRFMVNRWPLIEAGMSRDDCMAWMNKHYGRKAPKSSCVYCAFQSPEQWLNRRLSAPDDFAHACGVDDRMRSPENVIRFHGKLFLHASLMPLRDVDFASIVDERTRKRETGKTLDLFSNECEGVCGV